MDEKEIIAWVKETEGRTVRFDSKFFPDESKLHDVLLSLGADYEAIKEVNTILIRPKSN
jgi:hypothetical protein